MNCKYYYWWFKNILSPKMCDDIINMGLKQKSHRAITGTESLKLKKKKNLSSKDVQDLKKIRNSKIVFLQEKNLFRIINHYLNVANSCAGWNLQYIKKVIIIHGTEMLLRNPMSTIIII